MPTRWIPVAQNSEQLFDFEREMLESIQQVDEYCKKRGELGGFSTGFEAFDRATEGLQSGLILLGGQPNTGKTAMLAQLAWQVANIEENNAYVIYMSLDDNMTDVLPRIVACDQQMPINAVRMPKRYTEPEYTLKRARGLRKLKNSVKHFKMLDQNHGNSLEYIETVIRRHKTELELAGDGRRLCLFVDNFYDVVSENVPMDDERYEYVAIELDRMAQMYDLPIVCTAEFRKLNSGRRPTLDDLRQGVKIAYKAKLAILAYNEVGLKGDNANIYYNVEDDPRKQPVLELHFAKNKFTSFKGRLFYEFIPHQSRLVEASEQQSMRYSALIYQA